MDLMSNYTFFSWLWIMHMIFFKLNTGLCEAVFGCNFHEFQCLCIIYISQQYPFTTLSYECFTLVIPRILAHILEPKTLRCETLGFCSINSSKGFTQITDLWWTLLWIYGAQFTTSAHRYGGIFLDSRMHVAISFRDVFFLSSTPFCYVLYGTECCISIPY